MALLAASIAVAPVLCSQLVAPDALKKGLSLSYSADPSAVVAPLMADPIRLRQVSHELVLVKL
jgi:hypothetical protein